MSKLKHLIGQQESNLSVRVLGRALGLSVGAVSKYLRAVKAAGIDTKEAEGLSEAEIERPVFAPATPGKPVTFVQPDCAWIHSELGRHRHLTLQLALGGVRRALQRAAYRRSAVSRTSTTKRLAVWRSDRPRLGGDALVLR